MIAAVRGREIAIIFQEPMTALNPVLPIGVQITESLACTPRPARPAAAKTAAPSQLLDQVGIPAAARRLGSYPHEFSGGMRQRAMIAIALAAGAQAAAGGRAHHGAGRHHPGPDPQAPAAPEGRARHGVILVTHDLGVVAGTCDRVAVMYAGRVMETGPAAARCSRQPGARLHARPDALPARTVARARLNASSASPAPRPKPGAMPPGCRFAPRCAFATVPDLRRRPTPNWCPSLPGHDSACLRADAVRHKAA